MSGLLAHVERLLIEQADEPGSASWQELRDFAHELGARPCSACRQLRDETDFADKLGGAQGLESRCRDCKAAAFRSWKRANPERQRAGRLTSRVRRRLREAAAFVEDVDPLTVYERDGWLCGLCGEPIDPELRFPEDGSATVDHVVELVDDGLHSYANVQAAHWLCNRTKELERKQSARVGRRELADSILDKLST